MGSSSAFAELFLYVLTFGLLIIPTIGLTRLLILRNDNKPHYITKFITTFFLVILVIGITVRQKNRNNQMKKLSGNYKILNFKCEECNNCVARLSADGRYTLIQNKLKIDSGTWYYTKPEFMTYIIFNDDSEQQIDNDNIINSIKNNNCTDYWRNQNLSQSLNGTIVFIDSINTSYNMNSIKLRDSITKDTINYKPKYYFHPQLNNKIVLGDYIMKKENSMKITIIKRNDDTLIINENLKLENKINQILNKN